MLINPDFSDLFAALNAVGARYLLVGGYAVAVHSAPRATKDLDVWVDPTPANAQRVYAALASFGAPLRELTVDDLAVEGIVYQIGVAPNRIDIIMKQVWSSTDEGKLRVLEKFQLLMVLAGQVPLDKGGQPYQDAHLLIQLRNALAHYQPRACTATSPMHWRRNSGGSSPTASSSRDPATRGGPITCLGAGCSEWAHRLVQVPASG